MIVQNNSNTTLFNYFINNPDRGDFFYISYYIVYITVNKSKDLCYSKN